MSICSLCGKHSVQLVNEAGNTAKVLYVKNNRELLRPDNISRIALELAAVSESSREVINWMADTLFIEFDGVILWPNGKQFEIGDEDLDRVFNTPTVSRWLRSIRQFAGTPAKQTAPTTLAKRYRLLDVTLQAEAFIASRRKI